MSSSIQGASNRASRGQARPTGAAAHLRDQSAGGVKARSDRVQVKQSQQGAAECVLSDLYNRKFPGESRPRRCVRTHPGVASSHIESGHSGEAESHQRPQWPDDPDQIRRRVGPELGTLQNEGKASQGSDHHRRYELQEVETAAQGSGGTQNQGFDPSRTLPGGGLYVGDRPAGSFEHWGFFGRGEKSLKFLG
jgi:hypothetical protein